MIHSWQTLSTTARQFRWKHNQWHWLWASGREEQPQFDWLSLLSHQNWKPQNGSMRQEACFFGGVRDIEKHAGDYMELSRSLAFRCSLASSRNSSPSQSSRQPLNTRHRLADWLARSIFRHVFHIPTLKVAVPLRKALLPVFGFASSRHKQFQSRLQQQRGTSNCLPLSFPWLQAVGHVPARHACMRAVKLGPKLKLTLNTKPCAYIPQGHLIQIPFGVYFQSSGWSLIGLM